MISDEIQEWLNVDDRSQIVRSVEGVFSISTDIGLQRSENQDRVAVLRVASAARNVGFWCACLCDGMGGMREGGLAASLAISSFFQYLVHERKTEPKLRLERAVIRANEEVRQRASGGGATLSAVLIERETAYTVNVGDSRIYELMENGDDGPRRLTTDDTMEEAYGSQGRGLLQHLGMSGKILPHIRCIAELSDQHLIITSDGAHRVGDSNIGELWVHATGANEFCTRILSLARWKGGVDNASVIVVPLRSAVGKISGNLTSDVSVWTTAGRLKVSWSSANGDMTPPRSSNRVEAEDGAHSDAGGGKALNQDNQISDQSATTSQQVKSRSRSASQRSRRSRGKKNEDPQIKLGFANDDGDP